MKKKKENIKLPGHVKRIISDLLSIINHDLRSPAASIRNAADILEKNIIDDPETKKDFICMISDENNYSIELIKDMITTARIDLGLQKWDFENSDTDKLIKEINENTSCLIQRKKQTLNINKKLNSPLKIKIDLNRIIQVFEILISNASKFSDTGKEITIIFGQKDKFLEIMLKDQGCGIPNEITSKIFKKLNPHKYASNKPKGTGLGLYLAKKIIEAHKGSIKYETEANHGTTFTIYLPAKT